MNKARKACRTGATPRTCTFDVLLLKTTVVQERKYGHIHYTCSRENLAALVFVHCFIPSTHTGSGWCSAHQRLVIRAFPKLELFFHITIDMNGTVFVGLQQQGVMMVVVMVI